MGAATRNIGAALFAACAGLFACAPSQELPAFTPPPPGAAVPLPSARPAVDHSYNLPFSKDEVAIELHPRVKLQESVAADSDERTALAATVILTLPAKRDALRHVDVKLAVKRRPDGQVAETKTVSFDRDTRESEISVQLGALANGAYDVDVHTLARVEVLDDDWTVMVDTKEATERAALVIGGKREQSKSFEFHFDNDAAAPVAAERKTLDRTLKAIEALLAAHPDATARVDCWTSVAGEEARNRALAVKRCDWFKAEVWGRLARSTKDPLAAVPHSTSELAAEDRSRDVKVASRNRVVRLRVRWNE